MSKDIAPILDGWEYDPGEMQVRIIPGADGREKIQVRLDLGLFQMERDGRPDGARPNDFETALDFYEAEARAAAAGVEPFELDGPALAELFREGFQFYHRYLALFQLERYDLVARDTARNLRLFAFVVQHAPDRRDRLQFDQHRPYVTMMNARALALQALARDDDREALRQIDDGIRGIRAFLREYGREGVEATCRELDFLADWRKQVVRDRTLGPVERLEEQLERAIALEQFEEAARLRDQILRLRGTSPSPSRPA